MLTAVTHCTARCTSNTVHCMIINFCIWTKIKKNYELIIMKCAISCCRRSQRKSSEVIKSCSRYLHGYFAAVLWTFKYVSHLCIKKSRKKDTQNWNEFFYLFYGNGKQLTNERAKKTTIKFNGLFRLDRCLGVFWIRNQKTNQQCRKWQKKAHIRIRYSELIN